MGMKIASTAEFVKNADINDETKYVPINNLVSEPLEILTIHEPIVAARPVSDIAAPIIITPIVNMTVLDAKGLKASLKLHTPKITIATQPKIAVVAIGNLSHINKPIHITKITSEVIDVYIG